MRFTSTNNCSRNMIFQMHKPFKRSFITTTFSFNQRTRTDEKTKSSHTFRIQRLYTFIPRMSTRRIINKPANKMFISSTWQDTTIKRCKKTIHRHTTNHKRNYLSVVYKTFSRLNIINSSTSYNKSYSHPLLCIEKFPENQQKG